MNAAAVSRVKALVAVALLLSLLVACSSEEVKEEEKVTIIEVDYDRWAYFEVKAWIDVNDSGKWDTGEAALANVQVWVDFVEKSGLTIRKDTGRTSDQDGVVYLGFGPPNNPDGSCDYGSFKENVVRSEVPEGFRRTTPDRFVDGELYGGTYLFGFNYEDAPTPEPTPIPSP